VVEPRGRSRRSWWAMWSEPDRNLVGGTWLNLVGCSRQSWWAIWSEPGRNLGGGTWLNLVGCSRQSWWAIWSEPGRNLVGGTWLNLVGCSRRSWGAPGQNQVGTWLGNVVQPRGLSSTIHGGAHLVRTRVGTSLGRWLNPGGPPSMILVGTWSDIESRR
jgi:hypothetical protein